MKMKSHVTNLHRLCSVVILVIMYATFSSCSSRADEFRLLWIEGTPPAVGEIDYYELEDDCFVVYAQDRNDGYLVWPTKAEKTSKVVGIDTHDRKLVSEIISLIESESHYQEEEEVFTVITRDSMISMRTTLRNNIHRLYTYMGDGNILTQVSEFDGMGCFCVEVSFDEW
jgi:hypothetical protein